MEMPNNTRLTRSAAKQQTTVSVCGECQSCHLYQSVKILKKFAGKAQQDCGVKYLCRYVTVQAPALVSLPNNNEAKDKKQRALSGCPEVGLTRHSIDFEEEHKENDLDTSSHSNTSSEGSYKFDFEEKKAEHENSIWHHLYLEAMVTAAEKEKELKKIRRELKSEKAFSCHLAKKVASTEKEVELEEDGIQQSEEDTIAVYVRRLPKLLQIA